MSITIKTNNVPRFVIDAYELTKKEQKEFDYLEWDKLETGEYSRSFFRFKGQLYDLGEFMRCPSTEWFKGWEGYFSDSAFSGILIKYTNDFESVIVATYYS